MRKIFWGYVIPAFIILVVACGKDPEPDPQPPQPPAPSISRFSPLADTIGATITVYGANFDVNTSKDEVKFNGVAATVLVAAADSLTAKVPATASTGKISVTVNGRSAVSASEFTVLYAPSITSFSPFGDTVGATVTIKGKYFGNTVDKNTVTFPGGVNAQIVTASDTQLVVKVPQGAYSGGSLRVRVNNYDAVSVFPFYVLIAPTITSFSPFAGPIGSTIEIKGTNFLQWPGGPYFVRFNGIQAQYQLFSNTSISATVPAGATSGKISISIGTVSGISATDFVISSQIWTRKKDNPVGREGAIGFSIGNKGYIGLGRSFQGDSARRDLWEYDPATNEWTRKADVPGAGKWMGYSFVINGKAYVVGGLYGPGIGNSFETWEYDPSNDQWTRKADFIGWFQIQPIAFSIGNKGYFGLGDQTGLWEFDPAANTWTEKANFPGGERQGAASFVVGNKAYMAGGVYDFNNKKDLWEYNPVTDTWTQKADCPGTGRYGAAGFSIGNYGYIGLGQTSALGGFLKDIWEYNPATNTWTRKVDFPFDGRWTPAGFSINGKAYVGTGGSLNAFYRDLWEFTP